MSYLTDWLDFWQKADDKEVKQGLKKPKSSFAPPEDYNGAKNVIVDENEAHGAKYARFSDDYGLSIATTRQLINTYRVVSEYSEVDDAIQQIVNESIVEEDKIPSVSLNLDETNFSEKIKELINNEFNYILKLYNFRKFGSFLFRKWYVDSRLYIHKIIDLKTKDIIELRVVEPTNMQFFREIIKKEQNGQSVYVGSKEFYRYTPSNEYLASNYMTNIKGNVITIPKAAITYVPSGIVDSSQDKNVIGYLHRAIKVTNQLKMLEDSLVIYRLARAPERRVFYIDVGGMPVNKARQEVNTIMSQMKNRIVYDSSTGKVKNTTAAMTMLEDIYLPRRDGSKGTQVDTLPSACLAMDTKVDIIGNGQMTITEIAEELKDGVELWARSCHPVTGALDIGIISWAGVTQTSAKVLKIITSDDKHIICTPDHKFPIKNIGFVQAMDLSIGDHLIGIEGDVKITNIINIDDPIEVGTLTIDAEEKYHNYHTFSIAGGIFTKNSNLGEIEDVEYFKRKLYSALRLPKTRMRDETTSPVLFGNNVPDMDRDELNFAKFIRSLQIGFEDVLLDPLKHQVLNKKILSPDEWKFNKENIKVEFNKDSYIEESKQIETFQNKFSMLRDMNEFVGVYFSKQTVYKKLFDMSEEEIEAERRQILKEIDDGDIATSADAPI